MPGSACAQDEGGLPDGRAGTRLLPGRRRLQPATVRPVEQGGTGGSGHRLPGRGRGRGGCEDSFRGGRADSSARRGRTRGVETVPTRGTGTRPTGAEVVGVRREEGSAGAVMARLVLRISASGRVLGEPRAYGPGSGSGGAVDQRSGEAERPVANGSGCRGAVDSPVPRRGESSMGSSAPLPRRGPVAGRGRESVSRRMEKAHGMRHRPVDRFLQAANGIGCGPGGGPMRGEGSEPECVRRAACPRPAA